MHRVIAATCLAATLALAGATAASAEDAPAAGTPPCYEGLITAFTEVFYEHPNPGAEAVFLAIERCKGYL
jgi:hypothetical protein